MKKINRIQNRLSLPSLLFSILFLLFLFIYAGVNHPLQEHYPYQPQLLRQTIRALLFTLAVFAIGLPIGFAVSLYMISQPRRLIRQTIHFFLLVFICAPVFFLALSIRTAINAGRVAALSPAGLYLSALFLLSLRYVGKFSLFFIEYLHRSDSVDFLFFFRSFGVTQNRALRKMLLNDLFVQLTPLLNRQFSSVLGNVILVETALSFAGLGSLLQQNIADRKTEQLIWLAVMSLTALSILRLTVYLLFGLSKLKYSKKFIR